MTATFPFYTLYDTEEGGQAVAQGKGTPGDHDSLKKRDPSAPLRGHNVRYGFVYKKVPHITLGSIATTNPLPMRRCTINRWKTRIVYASPGRSRSRRCKAMSRFRRRNSPASARTSGNCAAFEDLIFEHLKSAGVKTGNKDEQAVFTRIDRLSSSELHAEGFYGGKVASGQGLVDSKKTGHSPPTTGHSPIEKKAYLHIGPKFGPVSKQAVNEAIKACRGRHDADWLLILGFAFESGLSEVTTANFGSFKVSIVRMHDDLLQEGLLKKDKKPPVSSPSASRTSEWRVGSG